MIRASFPPAVLAAHRNRRPGVSPSPGLSGLRDAWVGRSAEFRAPGSGPMGWLSVKFPATGETAWMPVSVRTLDSLVRAVGADYGPVPGGKAFAFSSPVPVSILADLEPDMYRACFGQEFDRAQMDGLFSGIGHALSGIIGSIKKVASRAADAAKKAASAAAKAVKSVAAPVASAVKSAAQAVQDQGKWVTAGALIAGGVAVGIATGGAALPVAGALVGAGVGTATKSGSNLGKFTEWAPRAAIGGVAGAALGYGVSWVMNGGLTQVGSSLFSSSTGQQVGTVGGAATAETTAATGGASSAWWGALPVGTIAKIGAGYVFKGSGGAALPFSPAAGSGPTDPGMTALPDSTLVSAGAAEWVPGVSNTVVVIAGVALLGALILGLRR